MKEKIKWKCQNGHEFSQTLLKVLRGLWCNICRKMENPRVRKSLTIEQLDKYANEFGGSILSDEYTKMTDVYKWKCNKGHIFTARAHNIVYEKIMVP